MVDCDDVRLQLSAHERPTLRESDRADYDRHLQTCDACRALSMKRTDAMTPIMRIEAGAFDSANFVLPLVDPMVFDIAGEIAAGGMGQVLLAHDKRLGRDVALKEILEPSLRPRFEREAAITARLQHPAIIPIYEAGTWPDGKAFYAMRLVDGSTLAKAIDRATTLEQRIALLPHVLTTTEALAYAHSKRVIHRDLKSGNVLVSKFGETVVIDWGLAKELDAPDEAMPEHAALHHELTRVGSVLGTPCFMPPEQARGEALDERADVYALGAILYHVLSGTMPYWDTHGSVPSTIIAVTAVDPPTPLAVLAPDTPADLCAIVEKAMARERADRYRTAGEMADELRRFEAGKLIARAYTLRELLGRWLRRHRTAVAISSIAVVVLAVIAVISVRAISSARDTAEDALVVAEHERVVAIEARQRADQQTAALLEERGRTELLSGDGPRALVYLSAAYDLGRDTPSLRYLIGAASRELELKLEEVGKAGVIGFARDGLVVTAAGTQLVRRKAGSVIDTRELPQPFDRAKLDRDARRLFISNPTSDSLIDVATGTVRWTTKVDTGFRDAIFDGDGKRVVLVERSRPDAKVLVIDDKGTAVFQLPGEAVVDAALSMDGTRLAVCGNQGTVTAWTIEGRVMLGSSAIPNTSCARIAFTGNRQVVFERLQGLYAWSFDKAPSVLERSYEAQSNVAVDATGDRFAIGAATGGVKIWGAGEHEVRDPLRSVATLAFTPDGRALLGRSDETRTFLWDLTATPRLRRGLPIAPGYQLAIDPDGSRFATISFEGAAQIWKLPRGPRIATVAAHESSVLGAHLLAVELSGRVAITELATGTRVRTLDGTGNEVETSNVLASVTSIDQLAAALAIGSTGEAHGARGALFESGRGRVIVRDPATGKVRFDHAAPERAAVALSGDTLIVAHASTLQVFDLRTRAETRIEIPSRPIHAVAVDERRAYVFEMGLRNVRVVDLQTRVVTELPTAIEVEAVGRGPGDAVVIVGAGMVQVWDATTLRFTLPGACYAISPDGALFATGTGNGVVSIYDAKRAVLLEQFQATTTTIKQLTFSADGRRLVAQGDAASIWDIPRETATAAAVAQRLSTIPWTLVDGQLVSVKRNTAP